MLGNLFGRGSAREPGASTASVHHTTDYFVGRAKTIEAYGRYIDPQRTERLRVFAFHGGAGLGKSALLRHLRETLSTAAPGCIHATFDFASLRDTTQAWREVLCALRTDLGYSGIPFPQFDLLLGFTLAGAGGDHVLEPLLGPSTSDAFRFAVEALSAYNTSPENLLELLEQVQARQEEIFPSLENSILQEDLTVLAERIGELCRRAIAPDAGLPSALIETFASELLAGLPSGQSVFPKARNVLDSSLRGVLFFDSYEELWDDRHAGVQRNERQLDWWVRELAAHCLAGGVLPVISGLTPLLWAIDDEDWSPDDMEQHVIGRLTPEESREFLGLCGIGAPPRPSPKTKNTNDSDSDDDLSWASALLETEGKEEPAPAAATSENDPLVVAILNCCAGAGLDENLTQGNANNPSRSTGPMPMLNFTSQINCHPFWLALCAATVLQTRTVSKRDPNPAQFARLAPGQLEEKLSEQFIKSLGNRELEKALIALCLTPRFDEAAMHTLAGSVAYGSILEWQTLHRMFFVQAEAGRGAQGVEFLRIHPLMKHILQERIKKEKAVEEHLNLLHYWAERGETALSWFHQWRIDPDAAQTKWRHQHHTALASGDLLAARAQLTLWREIALDETHHRELGDALWARTHETIARALLETPLPSQTTACALALDHLQNAHEGYIHSEYNPQRSEVQKLMILARNHMILAEAETALQVGNLERARDSFLEALNYFTLEAHPDTWLHIQTNLAMTYRDLPDDATVKAILEIRPDIDTNATRATACFEAALRQLTPERDYELWAQTHYELAVLYRISPRSARLANQRKAINHYQQALSFFTEEQHPAVWGESQRALASCYIELRTDDRSQTLHQAIACYDAALRYFTADAFPLERAQLFHEVGLAWGELGDVNNDTQAFTIARTAFEAAATDFRALSQPEAAEKSEEVAREITKALQYLDAPDDTVNAGAVSPS